MKLVFLSALCVLLFLSVGISASYHQEEILSSASIALQAEEGAASLETAQMDEAVASLETFTDVDMNLLTAEGPKGGRKSQTSQKLVSNKTGKALQAKKPVKISTPKLTPVDTQTGKALQNSRFELKSVDSKTGKSLKPSKMKLALINKETGSVVKPAQLKLTPIDPKTGNKPSLSWPKAVPMFEDDEITAPATLGRYKVFQKGTVSARGFDVRFSAKGHGDAMVAFMCEEEERSEEAYEIHLGAYDGTRSVIRHGTQGKVLGYRDEDRHALRPRTYPDEYTTYWVSYLPEDEVIDVYTGTNNAPLIRGFKVPPLPCKRLKVAYGAWEKAVVYANRYVYSERLNKQDYYDAHFQALKAMDRATGDQAAHEAREQARRELAKQKELDRKRTLRAIKQQKQELQLVKQGAKLQLHQLARAKSDARKQQIALANRKALIEQKEAKLREKEARIAAKAKALKKKDWEFRKKRVAGLRLKPATKNGQLLTKKNVHLHVVNPKTGFSNKAPKLRPVNGNGGDVVMKPTLRKVNPKTGAIDKPLPKPKPTKPVLKLVKVDAKSGVPAGKKAVAPLKKAADKPKPKGKKTTGKPKAKGKKTAGKPKGKGKEAAGKANAKKAGDKVVIHKVVSK